MKKLLFAMLFFCVNAFAETVQIDGVWYELIPKAKMAEVTRNPDNKTRYVGDVVIPEKVIYEGTEYTVAAIQDGAFFNSYEMTSIIIPNHIKEIGFQTFANCSGLKTIQLPSELKIIGNTAFENCGRLEEITIPNKVTTIEPGGFQKCSGLKKITLGTGLKTIEYNGFMSCSSIKEIVIPPNVTFIGSRGFSNCSSLTKIYILGNCSLKGHTFGYCPEISDVYLYDRWVSAENLTFYNSKIEYATLHVTAEYIDSYRFYTPWKNFMQIVPITDDETSINTTVLDYDNDNISVYDLNGLRVSKFRKGINVIRTNGKIKKVLIK